MVHYRTHKLPIVNQMKLLLITLSILLTSSPLFGQETGVLYLWENGTKYMGEWKDGKRHGQGNMTYATDVSSNFTLQKNNVLTFHDGSKFVGKWKNGKRHGQGTYTWSDGDKYVGEFKDDKPNGKGTYTWSDGRKYEGEFEDGIKHGQGTWTSIKGYKYVGEWRENKSWNGKEYDKKGNIIGKYVNGEIQ